MTWTTLNDWIETDSCWNTLKSAKKKPEMLNGTMIFETLLCRNFLIENEINMNFYLKTDSYTSALALINQGIGIAIIDSNTIQNANLELVNVSKIIDNSFDYCINAIMKKNIPSNESREFFNFLSLQSQ